jgi:hypothetical protein
VRGLAAVVRKAAEHRCPVGIDVVLLEDDRELVELGVATGQDLAVQDQKRLILAGTRHDTFLVVDAPSPLKA